jgi:hypothetical protein
LLADLARSNALVILPEDTQFVAAGREVDVWLLDESPNDSGAGVSEDRFPHLSSSGEPVWSTSLEKM